MIEGVDDRSPASLGMRRAVDESSIMRLARWLGTGLATRYYAA